jgi:hypothetical protein
MNEEQRSPLAEAILKVYREAHGGKDDWLTYETRARVDAVTEALRAGNYMVAVAIGQWQALCEISKYLDIIMEAGIPFYNEEVHKSIVGEERILGEERISNKDFPEE